MRSSCRRSPAPIAPSATSWSANCWPACHPSSSSFSSRHRCSTPSTPSCARRSPASRNPGQCSTTSSPPTCSSCPSISRDAGTATTTSSGRSCGRDWHRQAPSISGRRTSGHVGRSRIAGTTSARCSRPWRCPTRTGPAGSCGPRSVVRRAGPTARTSPSGRSACGCTSSARRWSRPTRRGWWSC